VTVDEKSLVQRLGRRLRELHRDFPGLPRPEHRRAPTSLEELEAEVAWSRTALAPFLRRERESLKRARESVREGASEEGAPAGVALVITAGRTSERPIPRTGAILKASSLRRIAGEIALMKSEKGYGRQQEEDRLLRVDDVLKRVGVSSRVTLWRWMKAGRFPKAREVGPNVVRWSEREVREWMAERKAKSEV
jgi:prophage regulatory protein